MVKGASITTTLTGMPYVAGCLGPSLLVGGFTFMSQPKLVERANTALAGAMVLGFCVLVVSTLSGPSGVAMGAAAMATRLRAANWKPLMPSLAGAARGETWTLPVLLNLLCFGQSVPIVVGRRGCLLVTTHSLLTTYCSLMTAHFLLLTAHCSPPDYFLLTSHDSLHRGVQAGRRPLA